LEWRRLHAGEPLAKLSWRFLHFGPYAVELASILGGSDVEKTEFESGKVCHQFSFEPDELEGPQVPDEAGRLIAGLVKTWGDADLNALLDYVYFDTEPMEGAERGQLLDFSRLRQSAPSTQPKLDQNRLKDLRARLAMQARQLNLRKSGLEVPLMAFEGSQVWDEEDRLVQYPVGTAIKFNGA